MNKLVKESDRTALMNDLRERMRECTICPTLRNKRKRVVWSDGVPRDGGLMIVGEAPGESEDKNECAKPFVGSSGKLLNELITKYLKRKRSKVFVTNLVKCRPVRTGKNRPPTAAEIKACLPRLEEQIRIMNPRLIIAVGRIPGRWLSGQRSASLRQLRCQRSLAYQWPCGKVSALRVVRHPSSLLQYGLKTAKHIDGSNSAVAREAEEDWTAIGELLAK